MAVTLRAEIDEAAWASLYSTVSRPFPRPSSGRIAIKVINHYGDEILKSTRHDRIARDHRFSRWSRRKPAVASMRRSTSSSVWAPVR